MNDVRRGSMKRGGRIGERRIGRQGMEWRPSGTMRAGRSAPYGRAVWPRPWRGPR